MTKVERQLVPRWAVLLSPLSCVFVAWKNKVVARKHTPQKNNRLFFNLHGVEGQQCSDPQLG